MNRGATTSVAVNMHTILKMQVYHVPAVLWQYSVNAEMKTYVSEWSGSVLETASPQTPHDTNHLAQVLQDECGGT